MAEILSLRSENSKTFDLGSGKRRLEICLGAVHYKDNYADPAESWQDIDLTWIGNKITKAPYELTLSGRVLTVRDKKSGNISTIELLQAQGQPVIPSWTLSNGLARSSKAPGDIEIRFGASTISYGWVLPSANVPFEIKYRVTGSIPLITHASDEEGELPLEVTLVGDILVEKVTSLSRAVRGKIRIDPVLTLQPSVKDNSLESASPTQNRGSYESLQVESRAGGNTRPILEFNISTLPAGVTIEASTLSLYYYTMPYSDAAGRTYWAYRLTRSDWVESESTWNIYKTGFNWTTAGGDYVVADGASAVVPAINNWIDFSILALTQDARTNRGDLLEILCKDSVEGSATSYGVYVYSREYPGVLTRRPKLVITYYTPAVPTVTTQAVTAILATTATGNGNITDLGGPSATQHGHCWNTTGTPTTSNSKTQNGVPAGTGAFTSAMTGLSESTLYYVRAYATNTQGTAYGSEVTFTTLTTPAVTTQAVTAISGTTATGNGNITNLGVPTATQHGGCWNTTGTPTTADSKTLNGVPAATGAFTSAITGLTAGTKYYFRPYITNPQGTVYGSEVIFWADKGTVAPTDSLTRVSGLTRQFWAGKGGNAVYDCQITTGGISTTYIPPVGTRQEVAAVPQEHPTLAQQAMAGLAGPGFQYVDYVMWVNTRGPEWVQKTYGRIPLYQDWVKIMIDQFRTGAK